MKYYNQNQVNFTREILRDAPSSYRSDLTSTSYQFEETPNFTVPVIGNVQGPTQTVIPVFRRLLFIF